MKYWGTAICAFVLAVAMVSAQSESDPSIEAAGQWQTSDGAWAGPWTATLYIAGPDINGTLSMEGFPAELTEGDFAGSLVGEELAFGVLVQPRFENQNPTLATFTGVLSGRSISGEFTTPDGLTGTWQGEAQ